MSAPTTTPFTTLPDALSRYLITTRHHLHQHPELSFHETETTTFLKSELRHHGIRILDLPLSTGFVAQIDGEHPGPLIALRADIDALPVRESNDLPYISRNEGVMHACGHDLHMTSLLGAALLLNDHRDLIHGSIRLLFQPAEELGGALQVVETDALEGVEAIIGYHNSPAYAPGTVALNDKPMMAAGGLFAVTFTGKGTHAAHPEQGRSPIEAISTLDLALQTIVARNLSPLETAIVSVCEIHAGTSYNIIPDTAKLTGTVRVFNDEVKAIIKRRIYEIAESVAGTYGLTCSIEWNFPGIPVVSDSALTAVIRENIPSYATLEEPTPSLGGEDFAVYLETIPGVFAFIGSNGGAGHASIHSPQYIGLDDTLPTATLYFVNSALALEHEL